MKREWFSTKTLGADVTAGVMNGFIIVFIAISLASYICGDVLTGYINNMMSILLVSAITTSLLYSIGSSLPNLSCSPQDSPSIVLALLVTAFSATLSSLSKQDLFTTVYVAMLVMSLSTAIFIFVLGKFKLGNLTRFIPFPVVAGFLAGAGWLLFKGSWPVLIDEPLRFSLIPQLFTLSLLGHWLPALLFGLGLYFAGRVFSNPIVIPAMLFLAFPLYYLGLYFFGYSAETALRDGLLLGPLHSGSLLQAPQLGSVFHVQWSHIVPQFGKFTLLWVLVPIGILMGSASLEIITGHEVDYNRELKWGGIANFISPFLGGGVVSYGMVVGTALNHKLGAKHRIVGVISALVCLITLIFGAGLLNYIPKAVYAGVLILLSLDLMAEWLVKSWFRLSLKDNLIILTIFSLIVFTSLLLGIVVGLLIFLCLFVWEYSRVDVLSEVYHGDELIPHGSYGKEQLKLVSEFGNEVLLVKLKGYLFFGNSYEVFSKIINTIKEETHFHTLSDLVVDFSDVTGFDSTSLLPLKRLEHFAAEKSIALSFISLDAHVSKSILKQMQKQGIKNHKNFSDIMEGLEDALEHIIEKHSERKKTPIGDKAFLKDVLNFSQEDYSLLKKYLKPLEIPPQTILIQQGAMDRDLYLLEEGVLKIYIEGKQGEKEIVKVHPGTIVGQVAYYMNTPRTVSVKSVDNTCRLFRLTEEAFALMEKENPHLSSKMHSYIASVLCQDLSHSHRVIYMALHH